MAFTTFGKLDGGEDTTTSSADKIVSSKFVTTSAGTLTGGHARMWLDAAGSTTARMLVYADDTEALLATSDQITVTATTESVRDFVFSGANQIAVNADTPYWLALAWDDPGTPSVVYSRGTTSGAREERGDITYGTFPNPFGTATGVFAGPVDVWADLNGVTTGGGGGTSSSFGKTTDGAAFSASSADKTAVSLVAASASGTLTAGHARVWLSATGTTNTKLVVYADSSGTPGPKLAESDARAVTNTAEAVKDYTFSGGNQIALTNGTSYWIGVAWQDPGTPSLNLSRDSVTGGRREVASYAPNPFGTATTLTGPIDVYLDVTASSGGGSGGSAGYVLIATVGGSTLTYLDSGIVTTSGQTLGVGGIPTAAAGPNTVLVAADSTSRLNITTSGRTYDGQGHSVGGITITADNVTVQNFRIHDCTRDAVSVSGSNVTVQNCDLYRISSDGSDINGITLFGDGHRVLYNTAGVTDFMATGTIGGSHTDFVQTWNTSSKRSTSNLIIQGNKVVGPGTGDPRFIHQGVQGEGSGSTDGGGGGSGNSSGWLIADNTFQMSCVNQVLNFLDIDDVKITRNTFVGSSSKIVGTGDGSTGIVFYDDNVTSGFSGTVPSATAGPGPAGVGGSGGGTPVPYTYIVTAIDAAGNESAGAPGGGSGGVDTDPPTVPTNLTATPGDRRVGLRWDAATDTGTGVGKYRVLRGGVQVGEAAATSFVDIGLTNGVLYSYTVVAVDRAGNASAAAAAVTATPVAATRAGGGRRPRRRPARPREVAIAWGADLSADESTWAWSDITADVRADPGISTSLGRNDESSTSNPASLALVLDNSSGDYSLGGRSAHWPYVRRNAPVRVRIDPGDGSGGRVVFMGFADGFTPGWDSLRGNLPVVTLSASGTLRRLSQGDAPVTSAYRRVMTALGSVKAYWPFEEGESASFAPAVRGGGDMKLYVDSATPTATPGRPDWNADSSLDCSAPLPRLGRAYFQADVNAYPDTGASQVRFLLSIPEAGLTDGTVLCHISMTGTIHRWDVTYGLVDGVATLALHRYDAPPIPGTLNSFDVIRFPVNGVPGRFGLDWTQSGSNIVWTMSFTPATPDSAATFFRRTLSGRTCGIVRHIEINPHNADIGATIGHLTVQNVVTSFFTETDELVAHTGEVATSTSGRLARLCTENSVKFSAYGSGAALGDSDNMGPQLVAPLLDLLHECEASDQGQLWDGRGAGLFYTSRRARELGGVKLTIDATAGELAGDFAPTDDDQRNRNRMTVTKLHGVTVTKEDATGPLGTAAVGIYDDAVTVNNGNDSMAHQYAQWLVGLGTVTGYRYPSVSVNLAASPDLAGPVLDLIPGERVDVVGLDDTLAGFAAPSVSLLVEGISHDITPRTWTARLQCSLFEPWAVGEVAAATGDTSDMVMRLDTAGAQLYVSYPAGTSAVSVLTNAGPSWTTVADDYPLYLSVGGLRVRATGCANSTPAGVQVFTIDPLPAARAAGVPVQLWEPRRIGLGGF